MWLHSRSFGKSRDELITDVLLWTPIYGRAKAGSPARTYIQQLCEDIGCSPEDLPEAMNDKKWRERVKDTRACGMTWWWWWWQRFYCLTVVSDPNNLSNHYHVQPSARMNVKLSPFSQGRTEGSLFNSYYTEVRGRRYSFPWIIPLYPWNIPYIAKC